MSSYDMSVIKYRMHYNKGASTYDVTSMGGGGVCKMMTFDDLMTGGEGGFSK